MTNTDTNDKVQKPVCVPWWDFAGMLVNDQYLRLFLTLNVGLVAPGWLMHWLS